MVEEYVWCIGQFEGVKPVTAVEGWKVGYDCPEPLVKPRKRTVFGNMNSLWFGTFLFLTFPSCDWLYPGYTNFLEIYEPCQNSRREMGDVRQVPCL